MGIVLVQTKNNWADEMNLGGFALFTDTYWKSHLKLATKLLSKQDNEYRMGIGSNQELYFDGIKAYKKQITTKTITPTEATKLCSLFGLKINDRSNVSINYYSKFGVLTILSEDAILEGLYAIATPKERLIMDNTPWAEMALKFFN